MDEREAAKHTTIDTMPLLARIERLITVADSAADLDQKHLEDVIADRRAAETHSTPGHRVIGMDEDVPRCPVDGEPEPCSTISALVAKYL